jgi:hypothetical protein
MACIARRSFFFGTGLFNLGFQTNRIAQPSPSVSICLGDKLTDYFVGQFRGLAGCGLSAAPK